MTIFGQIYGPITRIQQKLCSNTLFEGSFIAQSDFTKDFINTVSLRRRESLDLDICKSKDTANNKALSGLCKREELF